MIVRVDGTRAADEVRCKGTSSRTWKLLPLDRHLPPLNHPNDLTTDTSLSQTDPFPHGKHRNEIESMANPALFERTCPACDATGEYLRLRVRVKPVWL